MTKEKEKRVFEIMQNKNASTSLYHYYQHVYLPNGVESLQILYWDRNGCMDTESMRDIRGWWDVRNLTFENQRQATEYGTIALLWNSDSLINIPWDILPPVPILFYTIPNQYYNPSPNSYYKLILVPHDRNDANRKSVRGAIKSSLAKPYQDRYNIIIWRGSTHTEQNRLKLVSNISSVDSNGNVWLDAAEAYHNVSQKLSKYDMGRDYKYQLDIGGVSGTSWNAIRWKMCSGNVVFKVDSWSRDWWYDMIIPWKHYIPVKEDLSDLYEQYIWAETHPTKAYQIAQQGQKICLTTSQQHYMESYESKIIQSLPPASLELVLEMNLIRHGHLIVTGKQK